MSFVYLVLSLFVSLIAGSSLGGDVSGTTGKKYVARFKAENSGVIGEVVVDNGKVSVELDLNQVNNNDLPDGLACLTGGFSWHIHEMFVSSIDVLGSDACADSKTGGHEDPWNACGPASGNDFCDNSGQNESCIFTVDYSPDFENDPYSVEVGDWAGKYGSIVLPNDLKFELTEFSSFYEVIPSDVQDLAVVFHCKNSGKRAFCAPFEPSAEEATAIIPDQPSETFVQAVFDVLSDDSQITLKPDGSASIQLDAKSEYQKLENKGCSQYEYSVFNPKSGATLESSALGTDCKNYILNAYDPTDSCVPWSESAYCSMGKLCGDEGYVYSCLSYEDRYACAPGDLSGKFGPLDPNAPLLLGINERSTLLPPTDKLVGKIIGIHCAFDDQPAIEYLACAVIKEVDGGEGESGDGNNDDEGGFGLRRSLTPLAIIVVVGAYLFLDD